MPHVDDNAALMRPYQSARDEYESGCALFALGIRGREPGKAIAKIVQDAVKTEGTTLIVDDHFGKPFFSAC